MISKRTKIIPFLLFILITGYLTLPVFGQTKDELYQMSITRFNQKRFKDALDVINFAIQKDSSNADYFLQRAKINFETNNYDNSIRDCYSALRIQPQNPEVYYVRGMICKVTESYGGSILFFGKTIKFTDDNQLLLKAYRERGKAYAAISKYEDAQADFISALNIEPKSIDILLPLAESYYFLRKYDEAKITIDKVLAIKPDHSEAYELLGQMMLEIQDYNKALEAFTKYSTLNPDSSNSYYLMAKVYLDMKDYNKSFNNINRAINISPNESINYKLKGQVYLGLNQAEPGCDSFFKAMQLRYIEDHGFDIVDLYIEKCEEAE